MKFEKEKWYKCVLKSSSFSCPYLIKYIKKSFSTTIKMNIKRKKRIFIFHGFGFIGNKLKEEYKDIGELYLSQDLFEKGEGSLKVTKMKPATKNEINELVADQL